MSVDEMREMIGSFGGQLRWAAEIRPPVLDGVEHLLVAGMGGSGISADFATALANRPVAVHKSYGLPVWAPVTRPQVIVLSYSGNTEETLSVVEAAVEAGLTPAVVCGGGTLGEWAENNGWPCIRVPAGLQPRAALGYLLGSLMRLLGEAGVVGVTPEHLVAAGERADAIAGPGGTGWALARDLAEGLDGRIVGVYGATGLAGPVAQRWKTQINENAKWPAWYSLLPELDHNEIVSWASLAGLTRRRVGIVTLRDRGEPPGVAARFAHTAEITGGDVTWVGEVWSQGDSPIERMVSLTAMGDLVSVELAIGAGVDPVPVEAIENLKRRLAEEDARDTAKPAHR
jgi:glucose/mannose-6-phosphate isomerase